MVKTGIPFMLHEHTSVLLGSEFVDLYERMYLRVFCRRRDPDGVALYEVHDRHLKDSDIPAAIFEYGAAGALGSISFIGPDSGSLRTHTMAAFLVEVRGYANTISPFPPHPHTSAHAVFLQNIDRATGNLPLPTGMNTAGVGE
jgi:hypothetical protein